MSTLTARSFWANLPVDFGLVQCRLKKRIGFSTFSVKNMISAQDFKISSCQAVLFTPDEGVSIRKFLDTLAKNWSKRFDSDPVILPGADTAPRELPRVLLRSNGADWRCQIGPARLDVFWQKTGPDVPSPSLSEFLREASDLVSEYKRVFDVRAARLATVVARYVHHESPGLFLARHFCQDRWLKAPLNRPESFELHARKAYVMAGLCTINSWVRNKTGVVPAESNKSIILVEQDLNTLAEEVSGRAFSEEQIRSFFSAASTELDNILFLYYPEASQ
jgi:hypothetical protein